MPSLDEELSFELDIWKEADLLRHLRRVECLRANQINCEGRSLLSFSSNDYLNLSGHPALLEAAHQAVVDWGTGSRASRLISGSLGVHHQLEEALADWKRTEAALVFSSGYATALGVLPALAGINDVILTDQLVHACCWDAARLSKANVRAFRHNDLDHLEDLLRRLDRRPSETGGRHRRTWILVESVYSMDGDLAPIEEIVRLKEKYGAWLFVDEAHATGLHGARRAGCIEATGLSDRVEVQMGTLGKALGSAGGYICGSRILVEFLINRARSFVFSTAPNPASSSSALAAVRLVQSEEGSRRCRLVWDLARQLGGELKKRKAMGPTTVSSAILPWIVGTSEAALKWANHLYNLGFWVPAIRYPTVPKDEARLRFTVNAAHTGDEVDRLLLALGSPT